MKYTIVQNWGWFKHDNCKGAFSLHSSDCKVVKTRDMHNCQGTSGPFDDVKTAVEEMYFDAAVCRFVDVVKQYGFWQMVIVCKCSNETKTSVKQMLKEIA